MTMQISGPVRASRRGHGALQVKSIDLSELGQAAAPLEVFDDFRVSGSPFEPHPHAGFSAVSYIFEDSLGHLRSRDSLGGDYVVGPGGIVWSQAARGMMHEELPVDPSREIHGLQIFVNLGRQAKELPAAVLRLDGPEVPVWTDGEGNRVRVVSGRYKDIESPLRPAEQCDLLDIRLQTKLEYVLADGCNAFLYCETGAATVVADGAEARLEAGSALAVSGRGILSLAALEDTRIVLLSGLDLREPVTSHGPFIMNTMADVQEAVRRYERGEMGRLVRSPR